MNNSQKKSKGYFVNNFYALKMMWSVCKRRTIHIAIKEFSSYFEWIFYQIFFLRYVVNSIEHGNSFESIFSLMMVFCGIFVVLGFYNSYLESYINPLTDVLIYKKVYQKLFQKARNVELECFEESEFYSKYTMAIDNAPVRITNAADSFLKIFFGTIAFVVAFCTIYSMDKLAGFFIILPLLGNFYFGKKYNNICASRNQDNVKNMKRAAYIDRIMYLVDYAKEIRYSNIHDVMMVKYDQSVNDTVNIMDQYGNKATKYVSIKNIMSFPMVFEGIMLYSAYRTMVSGSMDLATLAIMFSTMSTTSWILIGLFNAISESFQNGLYVQYIKSFLEIKEKISEEQDGIMPSDTIESIEFRDITFYYKKERPLIKHMSFKINKNTTAAIVGCNGAGKSTLIKLLLRLYDPCEGEILINGINIKKYNLKAYRELFSVAFQDYQIMAMSIRENLLMGKKIDQEDERIDYVLKKVGLYSKVNTYIDKTKTLLTKEFNSNGVVMSGGESQKLAVARAFLKNSQIKIFDEPSSALDPIAEHELYHQMMKEGKKGIMFYISHRLSSVKDADYVFMLDNGTIIEQGTHAQLMKLHAQYYDMYAKQAMNYLAIDQYIYNEQS